MAIDILFFFMLLRLLCYRFDASWLSTFASVGKPLVDWSTNYIKKAANCFSRKIYTERSLLAIGMITLFFVRFFLAALFIK